MGVSFHELTWIYYHTITSSYTPEFRCADVFLPSSLRRFVFSLTFVGSISTAPPPASILPRARLETLRPCTVSARPTSPPPRISTPPLPSSFLLHPSPPCPSRP